MYILGSCQNISICTHTQIVILLSEYMGLILYCYIVEYLLMTCSFRPPVGLDLATPIVLYNRGLTGLYSQYKRASVTAL